MARIAGVDLPSNKQIAISLTYVYGIGQNLAKKILTESEIPLEKKAGALSQEEVGRIRSIVEKNYKVEGDLRTEVSMNIKRLIQVNSYRGIRHLKKLPVRGQNTHSNARTRKGKKAGPVAGARHKGKKS